MFADRTNWNLDMNRLAQALVRRRVGGEPVIDLTVSNPTDVGFTHDETAILRALSKPDVLAYRPDPKGLSGARQALAGYYAALGARLAIEDMFLTASTSEAYSFVCRLLCNPGDDILVPAPSYPLLDFLADIHDVRLARYPLYYDGGWQTDIRALESAVTSRTRGVIVVHPNNPTGHFAARTEVAALNRICASREIALIADEVFLDFVIGDRKPATFAANGDALTFTLSGLSKLSGLPQMKAAWLVVTGPERAKREAVRRIEVIADTYLSVSAPVQLALPEFLEQRHGFQKQLLTRVRKNLAELDRQLVWQPSCRRLAVEGGWNAVLRVPAMRSDEDLAIELLTAKNVHVHPGHFYDFPSDGYLVISLILQEEIFAEGVTRLLSSF